MVFGKCKGLGGCLGLLVQIGENVISFLFVNKKTYFRSEHSIFYEAYILPQRISTNKLLRILHKVAALVAWLQSSINLRS
jgi:hypothetical protein